MLRAWEGLISHPQRSTAGSENVLSLIFHQIRPESLENKDKEQQKSVSESALYSILGTLKLIKNKYSSRIT
jgi:hypothetical protein